MNWVDLWGLTASDAQATINLAAQANAAALAEQGAGNNYQGMPYEVQQAMGLNNAQPNIPSGILAQNDPALSGIANMAASGCNFRSCQSVAELETGIALTAAQIADSVKAMQDSGALKSDMTVKNPDAVINDAFDRLGQPGTTATVGWGGKGASPDYEILWGDTPNNSNKKGADHARLGDGKGNLLKDSYNPPIKGMTPIYSNPVYLHK